MLFQKTLSLTIVAVALVFSVQGDASAGSRVPESRAEIQLSYAPVVRRVAPAVVNIYTRKVVRQRVITPFDDPFFRHFFGNAMPQGMTRERLENSLGSGVLVRPDGLIVTSNHVIEGADQITVVLNDRREFEATLVTKDDHSDLAVLRINPKGEALPYLDLKDSDDAEVGDMVLAVGNPFGVGQTVTSGIVSALARTDLNISDINYFIQTDAAINPGNSGGALVTMDGKLIGINSAIYSRDGGNMGIGFAIPSNMVRVVIGAGSSGQKNVVRPWTGIEGQEVTSDVAASMNMARPTGMLVNTIHAVSPAKTAGLKVGDVIEGVNGKPVDNPASFRYRIATLPVNSEAALSVQRAGKKMTLNIKLTSPPEVPPREQTFIKGVSPLRGITIANISPAVMEELGLRAEDVKIDRGVVIVDREPNSPAANIGIRKGDILLRVHGVELPSVKEAVDVLNQRTTLWGITIYRDGRTITMEAVTR